ncbi:MAG: cytochrome c biogenesis protein CcdA [Leptolyngbyaceae cyanobacterium bins.59]|nr:cytochrome c biogenesis protein CcdA [Leptolyngbyaceae cyanobacterium bins.59]
MRRIPWALLLTIALLSFLILLVNRGPVAEAIVRLLGPVELAYRHWLKEQPLENPLILLPGAFLGGTIASVSPCILSLLPVNLSYIGSTALTTRREAARKAGLFVAGTITVLSVMGLFSSIAGALLVSHRGYVSLAVGALMVLSGLTLMEVFKFRLDFKGLPLTQPHPYLVGMAFSLVISPCTSPVFLTVLAAAAATGNFLLSALTMVSYGLGYTLIIFLCSLFTGLARRTRVLLHHTAFITRIASVALILTGGYYMIDGFSWFWPRS